MGTQGATKQTTEEIVTSIRLSRETHARLAALAASQHRSVSGQIRFILDEVLTDETDEKAAA